MRDSIIRPMQIFLIMLGGALALSVQAYEVTQLASGLDKPWSIAPIDGGRFLVTEKSGQLILLGAEGSLTPIPGTPDVYFANQGGLLEVLPDPLFSQNLFLPTNPKSFSKVDAEAKVIPWISSIT